METTYLGEVDMEFVRAMGDVRQKILPYPGPSWTNVLEGNFTL